LKNGKEEQNLLVCENNRWKRECSILPVYPWWPVQTKQHWKKKNEVSRYSGYYIYRMQLCGEQHEEIGLFI
jgi:hypothetical protein